ncbi:MAG: serine/threonine-protein kinase [Pseudomonadota bacterium]
MGEVLDGRYRVLGPLGRGGQGQVLAGEDLHTGRRVAIKRYTQGPERAARELRALGAVRHSHLVELLGHGPDEEGRLYVIEALIPGETLADRLGSGPLSPAEALRVIRDVAGALAALHAARHAHRDVTPGNVILSPGGAVLADLGLAHRLLGEVDLTDPGHLAGTPAYLPPEALAGDPRPGPAGDVYMLSVLLWHMVAGTLPWVGPTPAATIARLLLAPAEALVDTAAGIPEALRPVLKRGVAEDPGARWKTPVALADAVRSSLDGS